MYYDERKHIPFANELANGINFRSLLNSHTELTFEQTTVELVSVNLRRFRVQKFNLIILWRNNYIYIYIYIFRFFMLKI